MIIKFLKGFLDQVCKIQLEHVPNENEGITPQLEHVPNENEGITPQLEHVLNENESIPPQLLEHLPSELIHHIQSLLPAKDATRTCVLSKLWLHVWSTIPTLRFTTCATDEHLTKEEEMNYIKLIDRTLLRYLNDNMSIECFHLHLDIYN